MGFHGSHNTNLTPTGLAHKLIAELTIIADLLSTTAQRLIIEKFCNYILEHRSSIADATNLLPLEAALLVIQVKEHENTNHEVVELYKYVDMRIKKLEGEIQELKKLLNDKG